MKPFGSYWNAVRLLAWYMWLCDDALNGTVGIIPQGWFYGLLPDALLPDGLHRRKEIGILISGFYSQFHHRLSYGSTCRRKFLGIRPHSDAGEHFNRYHNGSISQDVVNPAWASAGKSFLWWRLSTSKGRPGLPV